MCSSRRRRRRPWPGYGMRAGAGVSAGVGAGGGGGRGWREWRKWRKRRRLQRRSGPRAAGLGHGPCTALDVAAGGPCAAGRLAGRACAVHGARRWRLEPLLADARQPRCPGTYSIIDLLIAPRVRCTCSCYLPTARLLVVLVGSRCYTDRRRAGLAVGSPPPQRRSKRRPSQQRYCVPKRDGRRRRVPARAQYLPGVASARGYSAQRSGWAGLAVAGTAQRSAAHRPGHGEPPQ